MSHRLTALCSAWVLCLLSLLALPLPAVAAPPTAEWEGRAGGTVASVGVGVGALRLVGVGLAASSSAAGPQLIPRSTSSSSNLAAAVAGLPVSVATNQQTAAPDQGAGGPGSLAAVDALGISARALTTDNTARWAGDGRCPATGATLADSSTRTAGVGVTAVGQDVLSTGAGVTRGVVDLPSTGGTGSNRAVRSRNTGSIATIGILDSLTTPAVDPLVRVEVEGEAALTALANGQTRSSVTYTAPTIRVTSPQGTQTVALGTTLRLSLGLAGALGTVTITANNLATETEQDDGRLAAGTLVGVVSIVVTLPAGAGTVSTDVLPLSARAAAPVGGIDCPAPPTISAPANGSTVTDPTPDITGTGQPGATISVAVGGQTYGPVEVAADGTWTIPVTSALAPGPYTAVANQTDDLGNAIGTAQSSFRVADPVAITAPADGSTITDTTPTIRGTGDPAGTVTVVVDGTTYGPVDVAANGTWSLPVTTPLTRGNAYAAVATQTVGGAPAGTAQSSFRVAADVAITSPADGSTISDTTPVVTGTGEPGATVSVAVDGTTYGPVTVQPNGTWTTTVTNALAPGTYPATATQTVGGQAAGTDTTTFTVSTTAPASVAITGPADGSTITDPTPDITGTGQPGASVTVTVDGDDYGPVVVAGDGRWTVPVTNALDRGASYTATAAQTIGGAPAGSDASTFRLAAGVAITAPAEGSVTTDPTPTINGTGEPGAQVSVAVGGVSYGSVTVAGDGTWSITPTAPLEPGSQTATATQTVGGQPAGSDDVTFGVVAAPVIVSPADGSTISDATPDITGTGQPGASITVTVDGDDYGPVTVADDGGWTVAVTDALARGASYTATANQTVGGAAAGSDGTRFRLAAAIAITAPADGSTTTDTTPAVSGTGEPGASVVVTVAGVDYGPVVVSGNGAWTTTVTDPLAPGSTYTATATQTIAGEAAGTDRVTFRVTVAAAPVAITAPANGSTTVDTSPTITGTGQPGATVSVAVDGVPYGDPVTVAQDGTWTVSPPTGTELTTGDHTAVATQTVGGTITGTDTAAFIVAAAPVITGPADGSTIADATPTVTGTGAPGADIAVTVNGETYTTTVDPSGDWAVTVPAGDALDPGPYQATVTQTIAGDPAGSDTSQFRVAVPPTISSPANGSTIADTTPEVFGTGEPGGTITLTVDGADYTATVGPDGTWTVPATATLAPGTYDAVAAQTIGALSAGTATSRFTVSTTAPATVQITQPAEGSTTVDRTPEIRGTGDPGAAITVDLDGNTYPTTVQPDGTWSVTVPDGNALDPDTYTATATQTVVGLAPTEDTSEFTVAPGPVIIAPADGSTTTDPTPTVSGTGDPGATIAVGLDDNTYLTTVRPDGTWTVTVPAGDALDPGPYTATATQTIGGLPAGSDTSAFTVRSVAAVAITAPAEGSSTTDRSPAVSGTGEPGATITVTVDGDPYGDPVTVAGDGSWTVPAPAGANLSLGGHTALASQAVGGATAGTDTSAFTVLAPAVVVITAPVDGSLVTTATPTIAGTGQPGASITVTIGSNRNGPVTVAPDGTWTVATRSLAPGPYTATATQTIAGQSPTNDRVRFRVAAPPRITGPADGSSTTDPTPTVRGTGTPGANITVTIGGVAYGPVEVGADGRWSVTVTDPLAPGSYTAVADQTDDAGRSLGSTQIAFTVADATDDAGTGNGDGTDNGNDNGARGGPLASTGGPALGLLLIGLLCTAGGVGILVSRRRRQR